MLPMKKQVCVCIFIACVFCISIPDTVLGQGIPLAQRVFQKHRQTLQRADIQEILPQVLKGLKAPENQRLLNPQTINLVVDNPDLLPIFIPDIEPRFVVLLKADQALKNLLRDPLVQELLQSPAAIDELARLLGIRGGTGQNRPDLPAQQIYNQAIHSVVWILTDEGSGSGVLIDKERRLVVTNQHVTGTAATVSVVFPYRDRNGTLRKDLTFYQNNLEWLVDNNYATRGRVIAQNVGNDLAIVRLDWLPSTAREIQHDFSQNVEDSMEKGDKVHILGNPGDRLWNWSQGTFLRPRQVCLIEGDPLVGCLEMEGDTHGGNSGGPVLNGQGVLIGILTAGTDETISLAAPTKNIKTLLSRVPANLSPIPPQRTYPKRVFKIKNPTRVTVRYQIKWSQTNNWQNQSLQTGFIRTHRSSGQQILRGYPKIRFDHIAGDQQVTYKNYGLESTVLLGENADIAPIYRFRYTQWDNRLDLFPDAPAAPALSQAAPEDTVLLSNYPNPFNPETWIPYHLAKPAEVTVTIYAADGRLIRTLALGHQRAGVYQDKSRAAYWDGKNELGEPVASGVYFYTFTAGDFTATRKMLIIR